MIQVEKVIFNAILRNPDILKKLTGIDGSFFSSKRNNKIIKLIKSGKITVLDITAAFPEIDQPEINEYLNKCFLDIYEIPFPQLQENVDNILKEKINIEILKLIQKGAQSKTGEYNHDEIQALLNKVKELENTEKPEYVNLKDVDPQAINWLWYNKIPARTLSLLSGDPGAGKSMLALWIAARISKGDDWPDVASTCDAGSVILLAAEDGIADTIRVRIGLAGADVSKITVLVPKVYSLDKIINEFEYLIKKIPDVRLIIIDSVDDYMTGKKGNENIAIRAALMPLLKFATTYKISILAVQHLNKDSAKKAIYRTLGSIAYQGVPRSSWVVERDQEDRENKRRIFAPLKTNLSKNPTTLAFRIDGPLGQPAIEFEADPVDMNSDELLADEETKDRHSAISNAVEWIEEALKDGPILSKTILEESKENGIAAATLDRAKKKVDVTSCRLGDPKEWHWKLKPKKKK